ncbi:MAG TPA: hypothetical protein VGS18_01165, partial [Thermoplasmata archaeon]|nr:hypothetical protein [Thermoplasmata archaeon]
MPLGYLEDGGPIYLIARERSAQWPVDALRRGEGELLLRDRQMRGTIELVTDRAEQAQVLARFLQKYGEAQFARW